jgi:hypothetical protein
MVYHGGLLAPLFDPSLAEAAAHEMAEDGRVATMGYAAEFTPVNTNPFSSPGRKPGTLKAGWRKRGPITRGVAARLSRPTPGSTRTPIRLRHSWTTTPGRTSSGRGWTARPRASSRPSKPRRMGDDPQAALTWLTIGGVRVFARVVKHPGTTGHHMVLRAARAPRRGDAPHVPARAGRVGQARGARRSQGERSGRRIRAGGVGSLENVRRCAAERQALLMLVASCRGRRGACCWRATRAAWSGRTRS